LEIKKRSLYVNWVIFDMPCIAGIFSHSYFGTSHLIFSIQKLRQEKLHPQMPSLKMILKL